MSIALPSGYLQLPNSNITGLRVRVLRTFSCIVYISSSTQNNQERIPMFNAPVKSYTSDTITSCHNSFQRQRQQAMWFSAVHHWGVWNYGC